MLFDFHTHTALSDGELLPMELIRRAIANGYSALGISDHVSASTLERVIKEVGADCELAREHWDFPAMVSVEITHVPPEAIPDLAAQAKALGALYVVVHGETPVEPTPPGTNLAACQCADVDILAHPGAISTAEAQAAAENGVFLEISARQGHCLGNGRVVRIAEETGAAMLVNSDAHSPGDLLTEEFARAVAIGAGLAPEQLERVLIENPKELLVRAGIKL